MIGKAVAHYKIVSELDRGGMGVVYVAEDERLGRLVAVKCVSAELENDSAVRQRFLREARSIAAIEHDNICAIHDVGVTNNGVAFFVMPLYDGQTLRRMLARGPVSGSDCTRIIGQICEGLAHAHSKGIVHRDIKPGNILVTSSGSVKILDFGTAKLRGKTDLTNPDARLGTLAYMSPEQIRGEVVSHKSDIWATGVVLYEMLTGLNPFRAVEDQASVYLILNVHPEHPYDGRDYSTKLLGSFCLDLLEADPDLRPDAAECLARLREIPTRSMGASREISTRSKAIDSIAVLPLRNVSGDPGQEYFSDGLTEELLSSLSKIEGLRVASRTSSFSFRESDKSVREIGRILGVQSIIEGSVRRSGSQVRITVQLVDTRGGFAVWSDSYQRELKDVLHVQSEIASSVAASCRLRLRSKNADSASKAQGIESYLKGRYFLNRRAGQPDALRTAADYFGQAIEEDPSDARAHAGLAYAYGLLGFYDRIAPMEAAKVARDAAERALSMDPFLVEGHNALGWARLHFDWDAISAERDFRRAVALNPNNSDAHRWYGLALLASKRFDDALDQFQLARECDPQLIVNTAAIGWANYFAGRSTEALRHFEDALEFDPSYWLARVWKADALVANGDYSAAEDALGVEGSPSPKYQLISATLAYIKARSGDIQSTRRLLRELKSEREHRYVNPYYLSKVYFAISMDDDGYEWLDTALEERSHLMVLLDIDPQFDLVRGQERFRTVVDKIEFRPC